MKILKQFGSEDNLTGELLSKTEVVQSFTALYDKLISVSIPFGTYIRKNFGLYKLTIRDFEGKNIYEYVFNIAKLHDNEYFNIPCNLNLQHQKRYYLIISSLNSKLGKSVTLKYSNKKLNRDEIFYLRGIPLEEAELCCFFVYDDGEDFYQEEKIEFQLGLISVIIPIYNDYKHLQDTLNSIIQQTYNYYELIIVNDGSDRNNTIKIIEILKNIKYKTYGNIIYIESEMNRGASYARNLGAKLVQGEYLFFCDADVILKETIFEEMILKLQSNKDISWVYCNFVWGTNGLMKFTHFDYIELLKRNLCSTMSMLRTECFIGFDEKLKRLQDWDLWLRLAKKGLKGEWIDRNLFYSFNDNSGISDNNKISYKDAFSILKNKHKNLIGEK